MNNKKVKTYGLVLGVTLFVLLVAGFTYAALTWRSNNITINGSTECLDIDYTKGQDITGGNLLLLDKSKIISNNKITITNGMVLSNLTAKIKSSCTIDGYLTLNLKVTSLNSAFTSSGNSTGGLNYALVSYDPETYSTVDVTTLNGKTFDIIGTGAITSTSTIKLKDVQLSKDSTVAYMIIFYLDGDLTNNDVVNTTSNFKATIEGTITQGNIGGNLPTTYQEVEYISSTGTEYIKTNVYCGYDDTVKLVLEGNFISSSNSGAWQGVNAYLQHNFTSNAVSDGNSSLSIADTDTITISYNGSTHTESLSTASSGSTITRSWSGSSSYGGYVTILKMGDLQNIYSGTGVVSNLRRSKIYVNGSLSLDLIPAKRKSDSAVGMYDIVSNTFYTNNGTGTFGTGNNVSS